MAMECCLLCLETRTEYVDYIEVNSAHWMDFNLQNVIEMHLSPIIENTHLSTGICSMCWQELYAFHKFYMDIKIVHNNRKCDANNKETEEINPDFLTDKKPIEDDYETAILVEQILPDVNIITLSDIIQADHNRNDMYVISSAARGVSEANLSNDENIAPIMAETANTSTNIKEEFKEKRVLLETNFINDNNNVVSLEQERNSTKLLETDNIVINIKEEFNTNEMPAQQEDFEYTSTPKRLHEVQKNGLFNTIESIEVLDEGPVKRPTQINRNIEITDFDMELNNSCISSDQEDSIYEDIMQFQQKNKRGRPRKDTQNYSLKLEQKKLLLSNKMISRPVRKRKIPYKYLTSEIEGTKRVIIKNKHKEYIKIFLKTGKRGRPRLYLKNKNSSCNTSEEEIEETEQTQEFRNGNMPSSSKGKRGRPRKNVENTIESNQDDVQGTKMAIIKNKHKEYIKMFLKTGKRGRPRHYILKKDNPNSNISKEEIEKTEQHEHCNDNLPSTSKGKRGRPRKSFTSPIENNQYQSNVDLRPSRIRLLPRKYLTGEIQITNRFLLNKSPEKLCTHENTLKVKNKIGRPRKSLVAEDSMITENNSVKIISEVENQNLITTTSEPEELLVLKAKRGRPCKQYIGKQNATLIKKFKNRKRKRQYKDLMKNYIATSVRCMQLFKSKNSESCKS